MEICYSVGRAFGPRGDERVLLLRTNTSVLSALLFASTGATFACSDGDASALAPIATDPTWSPGTVFSSAKAPNARGLIDMRGLIHAHSVYSHDACDETP